MSEPISLVFYINGMTCVSCSGIIESFLKNSNANIQSINTNLTLPDPKRTVITVYDEGKDPQLVWNEIKAQIEEIGFNCESADYNPEKKEPPPPKTTSAFFIDVAKKILNSHWFLGALGCISGIALMLLPSIIGLSLAAMITFSSLGIFLTLILGAPSYLKAWTDLTKSQSLTMDTLFTISTGVVLIVSIASFFVPWLPMMVEAALLIYGFKHLGIAIQNKIKEQINYVRFQDRVSKVVRYYSENILTIKKLNEVQPGSVIEIHAGEIIPLDGICLEESSIYNTIRKGAILPRYFQVGAKVLAGMRLDDNAKPLKIRVTKTESDSYLAKLDAKIAKSIEEKAPIQIKTNRYLSYFIPTVIAFAVLSGLIIGIFFPPALAIQCAVSVLVSACPCTLGLMIPLTINTGMNKAADHQVHFKNATSLEQAEQIDVVIFDLNGTLTQGVPLVDQFKILPDSQLSQTEFLSLCAALEEDSTHPIGKAIYDFANSKNQQNHQTQKLESYRSGRVKTINNKKYSIGSDTLMKQQGISTAAINNSVQLEAGDNLIYVAAENSIIGYFIINDPLRHDAVETIQALTHLGKEVHLCTGADKLTAERYAKALNISTIQYDCVATYLEKGDKAKPDYIRFLKQKGLKVAMVGDAANDSDALAASDFGIAVISQDSDIGTRQQANAIIQGDSLLPIASAFAISKQTVTNIQQNLIMSLSYNIGIELIAGGLLIALGFILNPGIGVALMVIQACIIFGNVYRFKQQPLEHLEQDPSLVNETHIEDSHQKMNLLNSKDNSIYSISKPPDNPDYNLLFRAWVQQQNLPSDKKIDGLNLERQGLTVT